MTTHQHRPLALEIRGQQGKTAHIGPIMLTPAIDEDYWKFRVRLTDDQAIVGFPKFGTIGIGFAKEEDWNTNLPYTCDAAEIYDHIAHNAGDEPITREDAIAAIELVREAAVAVMTPTAEPTLAERAQALADEWKSVAPQDAGLLFIEWLPRVLEVLREIGGLR